MKLIGTHIDHTSLPNVPFAAHQIGARAFAFCPVNALRWFSAPISPDDAQAFIAACEQFGYASDSILPHSSLLINLCSPDADKLAKSRKSLVQQMNVCASLGLEMINFHPGATMKSLNEADALALTADSINYVLDHTEGIKAVIENTAGQGSYIGWRFEHLAEIIHRVSDKSRIGVCIDTCHAWAAGYDMSTPEGYNDMWRQFDDCVGFKYLRGMHLNDDLRHSGSRTDRHAPIGQGMLGEQFWTMLIADRRLDNIPLVLETPDPSLRQREIEYLCRCPGAS